MEARIGTDVRRLRTASYNWHLKLCEQVYLVTVEQGLCNKLSWTIVAAKPEKKKTIQGGVHV